MKFLALFALRKKKRTGNLYTNDRLTNFSFYVRPINILFIMSLTLKL